MLTKNFCILTFKVLLITRLFDTFNATPTTINAPPVSTSNFVERDNLKNIFGHCLHKKDVSKCLKRRVVDLIDDVTQSDDPLGMNLFNLDVSLKKDPKFNHARVDGESGRTFEDVISQKLKNLLESRVLQVKVNENSNVSGRDAGSAGAESENSIDANEARKKKGGGGGKHGMMMSGIGLLAFLAQMFLSKVAFMSGAALLLAKIALLFSALTSFKKSSAGAVGSDHVIYAADGKQGWQRSIRTMPPSIMAEQTQPQQQHSPDDLVYQGHSTMQYDGV